MPNQGYRIKGTKQVMEVESKCKECGAKVIVAEAFKDNVICSKCCEKIVTGF